MPEVLRQRVPARASRPGLQSRHLHAGTGLAEGDGTLVIDDVTGEAGQDRCESGQPWPVRHVSIG